ncbi:MAG TPA: hypothetical protein VH593_28135, partial [Ktedonobacteraceae bacterium]
MTMDTRELPNLYRTTIHLLWDHKQELLTVLDTYTQGLKVNAIPDGEVTSQLVQERLIPLITEAKIATYAEEYPGEYHEIGAQVGQAINKIDAMRTYINQVVRAIIRRWDNRFHMMPGMMALCVQEILEILGGQEISKTIRLRYMEIARDDFFDFYKDDLFIAKERGYYDWITSDDAFQTYLAYYYETPAYPSVACTQDAYHWAFDELTRHLER